MTETTRTPLYWLGRIGALRLMLGLIGLIAIVYAPSADTPTVTTGWGLVTTGVIPALGPIVFMVLLLDMIMTRVLMTDTAGEVRRGYRLALAFDAGVALALLLSWLPFLIYLIGGR